MKVNKLNERLAPAWEEFICQSNNGTLFHTLKFLSYHPAGRFKEHHLVITEKNNIIALFPAVEKDRTIISHQGASYGGFVLKPGLGIQRICRMVEQVIEYFRYSGYNKITLTQTPLFYYREPNQYIDFALLKAGFQYQKREITAVIPLKHPAPLLTFKADARRSTKKAMREGVKIKISNELEKFYKILKHNLGMRHNVQPTHTFEELKRLKKLLPDKIILFAAYRNNLMLGGIVIFVANPDVILAFYISHNIKYQQYRPVNLLFHEIIKWGKLQGFKYLDLGTFTLNMEPNWGLGRFKENHNARGFLRDTYILNL